MILFICIFFDSVKTSNLKLNSLQVGSDVHVCYKKTSVRVNSLMYTPGKWL
jgi:hypothetical protein